MNIFKHDPEYDNLSYFEKRLLKSVSFSNDCMCWLYFILGLIVGGII